jgi:hypothetical protein
MERLLIRGGDLGQIICDNKEGFLMETTFENAKVGDKGWSIVDGWGEVIRIEKKIVSPTVSQVKEMGVSFARGMETFSSDGKMHRGRPIEEENRTLFWDEVKIEAPPKPKKMVKKTTIFYKVGWESNNIGTIFPIGNHTDLYWANLLNKPLMKMTLEWEEKEE